MLGRKTAVKNPRDKGEDNISNKLTSHIRHAQVDAHLASGVDQLLMPQ